MENKKINPIIILDRISDDILKIGKNCVMRINVSLIKDINNNQQYFHKEYQYTSKNKPKVSLKRSFDYYISIENYIKPDNCEKAFLKITWKQFPILKRMFREALSWFTNVEYKKLFYNSNNHIHINSKLSKIYSIKNLSMNKWISIEPYIRKTTVGSEEPSVKMKLSSDDNFTIIPIDNLFGINDILSNFNMYMSAQQLIPVLNIPFGTNRYDINNNTYVSNGYTKRETFVKRTVKPVGSKDSIEDLM